MPQLGARPATSCVAGRCPGLGASPKRGLKKTRAGRFLAPAPSLAAGGEVLFNEAYGTSIRPPREFQSRSDPDFLKQFFLYIFDDIPATPLSKCQGSSLQNRSRRANDSLPTAPNCRIRFDHGRLSLVRRRAGRCSSALHRSALTDQPE